MSGDTEGQGQVKKYTKQAANTLKTGQQQFLLDPNFLIGQQRGYELGVNPFTFDAQTVANMKNTATEGAYGAFGGQMKDIMERQTAGSGARSGSSIYQQRMAAQGLGSQIANINRTVDTQAAMARPEDLVRAAHINLPILQQQYQWPRDIAGAYLGGMQSPVWQQPSAGENLASGIGSLGGMFLGGK